MATTNNNVSESVQNHKKETLKVEKAYTFFMVPFYYETENAISNPEDTNTLWIKGW